MNFYTLVTRFLPDEVAAVEQGLSDGSLHPMEAKKKLAHEIVSMYHGDEAADQAADHFQQVFQQRDLPGEIPVYRPDAPEVSVVDLLVDAGLAPSKSQARRLIAQGGVRIDGVRIDDVGSIIAVREGVVVQVGKRRFVKIGE